MANARASRSEKGSSWAIASLAIAAVACTHDFGAFVASGDGGTPPLDAPRDNASQDAPSDVRTDTALDAPSDAATDPGILCGTGRFCSASTQVCCQESPTPMCLPQPGTGCGGFTMPCDDAADCTAAGLPGDVCCALVRGGGLVTSVTCQIASQCRNNGPSTAFILCDPSVASPCPAGKTCGPNTTGASSLNGDFTCN